MKACAARSERRASGTFTPVHPKADPAAQDEFRSGFKQLALAAAPGGNDPVEGRFRDEARAERKGMLSRLRTLKGRRARVVRDRRCGYRCLFSVARPARGISVGHVCDRAIGEEMNIRLVDARGGLSLPRLPPCSPEPNSMAGVFNYLKSSYLANRLFPAAGDAREAVLGAWEKFAAQPGLIASIMSRDWAEVN